MKKRLAIIAAIGIAGCSQAPVDSKVAREASCAKVIAISECMRSSRCSYTWQDRAYFDKHDVDCN